MENKVTEMQRKLADKERQIAEIRRQPIINELVQLTRKDPAYFQNLSKADIEVTLGAARLASTRRKEIYGKENDDFDLANTVDAWEYDVSTGKMKHVFAKEIDKPVW